MEYNNDFPPKAMDSPHTGREQEQYAIHDDLLEAVRNVSDPLQAKAIIMSALRNVLAGDITSEQRIYYAVILIRRGVLHIQPHDSSE